MLLRRIGWFNHHVLVERSVLFALALLTGIGLVFFIQTDLFTSWDLRHGLWSPSYLLVHGLNPYGMGAPMQMLRSVWFPMGIGLFFPLGWLDYFQVTNVWLAFNIFAIVMLVWLAAGIRRPPVAVFALSVGIALLFPPVLSHLVLGQFSLFAALLFLAAACLVNERSVVPVGFMIAVALTKPQLAVLALPGFLIGFWRAGGLKTMLSFAGVLVASIAWLTLPLWLVYPQWVSDFIDILRETPTWLQPSLFRVMQVQFGDLGLAIWFLLALGLFVLNGWLWLSLSPRRAVIWSLALTTLSSPYVWSWDFVLLVPLMVYAFIHSQNIGARFTLGLGYAVCWFAAVWIRLNTDNSDERFWWLAPTIILIVCAGRLAESFVKSPFAQTET